MGDDSGEFGLEDYGTPWWEVEINSENSEAEKETGDEKWPEEKILARSAKRKKAIEKTVKEKKSKDGQQKLTPQKKPTEEEESSKPKRKRKNSIPQKKPTEEEESTDSKPKRKRKNLTPQKKPTEEEESTDSKPKRKRKKKKKTIEDVLAAAPPQPGRPADLQDQVTRHFQDQRSVIELEEMQIRDSCFLSSNDLTHSLSSYLKLICPKWSKIQKQHTEKSSVVVLIVCSSALRAIELIKQLTAFRGGAKALKLFAKHIKMEEQVKLLQKGVVHIGVGTPGRIGALIHADGLSLRALKYLVLDWNWRDQKLRRMLDIPEIKLDFMKLLDSGILAACREERVKIGLF